MIKKLTRHGNSLALVVDKPILELLGWDRRTPLFLLTDGATLVVTKAQRSARDKRIDEILARLHRRYGSAFRRLGRG